MKRKLTVKALSGEKGSSKKATIKILSLVMVFLMVIIVPPITTAYSGISTVSLGFSCLDRYTNHDWGLWSRIRWDSSRWDSWGYSFRTCRRAGCHERETQHHRRSDRDDWRDWDDWRHRDNWYWSRSTTPTTSTNWNDVRHSANNASSGAAISTGNAASAVRSAPGFNGGGNVTVAFRNVATVSLDSLRSMSGAAPGREVTAHFDSMDGNNVDVRLSVNPASVNNNVNVWASTTSPAAVNAERHFNRFFNNRVAVVSFGHQGSFGTEVRVAARVDLTGLDRNSLMFYSYNSSTNVATIMQGVTYRIDTSGFVHFYTTHGGEIVITDRPLAAR